MYLHLYVKLYLRFYIVLVSLRMVLNMPKHIASILNKNNCLLAMMCWQNEKMG